MAFRAKTILSLLFVSSLARANQDFGYEGQHGPLHWGEDYNTCVGKHQSPINIEEHVVKNISLPALEFFGFNEPHGAFLTNNGHTVMLRTNGSDSAEISGGPLGKDIYVFEQMHFHWGENDSEGSEDKINNHSFAMELHAVFYKKKYGSMGKAVHNSDGLTVLAYFFEASDEANPTYETIVDVLPNIEALDTSFVLTDAITIGSFLVTNISVINNYFTYNGSLTTPPCSEVVTWIDFKDPLPLSHKQIAAFRGVKSSEGNKLTHNFRPVQPLEDRIVYHNVEVDDNDYSRNDEKIIESNSISNSHSGQFKMDGSVISTVAAFLLTFRTTLITMIVEDIR